MNPEQPGHGRLQKFCIGGGGASPKKASNKEKKGPPHGETLFFERKKIITKSTNNYITVHYLQKAETQTKERTIQ